MRKRNYSKRVLLGAAAMTMLFAGSAFTGANTGMNTSEKVGYGETTVSGATVNSLDYNFSGDKDQINSVKLVLDGDTLASTVEVLFDDDTSDNASTSLDCGTGTVSGTSPVTTYTCSPASPYTTSSLVRTAVVVTGGAV